MPWAHGVQPATVGADYLRSNPFLPDLEELVAKEARGELTEEDKVLYAAARPWHEFNPMLGTRGCRLGIVKPGLYRMQVRALMQAACQRKAAGGNPIVEIMIPLI